MEHAFGYATDTRLRDENQDAFGVFDFGQFSVAVVCDGMGGHVGGAQASALAVRTIHDSLKATNNSNVQEALRQAVQAANTAIYEEARKNYRLMGMGTTCVVTVLTDDTVYIAHVGDSRVYLLRQGEMRSLTRDHTMVNLFVDAELLSPQDAATHPEAHVLSRSLGVERSVDVELQSPLTIRPGDRLMLATDGVHRVVGDDEFDLFNWDDPTVCVDQMMAKVSENHGDDNATVVVVTTNAVTDGMPMTSPPDLEALKEAARSAPSEDEIRPVSGSGRSVRVPDIQMAEPSALTIPSLEDDDELVEMPAAEEETSARAAIAKPVAKRGSPQALKFAALAAMALVGGMATIGAGLTLLSSDQFNETAAEALDPDATVAEAEPADRVEPSETDAEPEAVVRKEIETESEPPEIEVAEFTTPEALEVAEIAEVAEVPEPTEIAAASKVVPDPVPAPTHFEPASLTEPTSLAEMAAQGLEGEAPAEPLTLADFARMHQRVPEMGEGQAPVEGEEIAEVTAIQFDSTDLRTCRDCNLGTWGRVIPVETIGLAEFSLTDDKQLTVAIFAPDVPQAPVRRPHRPSTYLQTPPRGQEQWQAVQFARNEECAASIDTVQRALDKSTDFAPLYLQAWYCFNDTHQNVLLSARPETRGEFETLAAHFDGGPSMPELPEPEENVEGEDGTTSTPRPRGGVLYDATDGIEYRLHAYLNGTDQNMFADVINDLLGEATVADHLGTDVLLEAYAAAAYARMEHLNRSDTYAWARRLYTVEHAMRGNIGDLLMEYRPDLLPLIDTLIYEAKGGDSAERAQRAGVDNKAVPYIVALAYAHARGQSLPSEARAQLSHPVASVKRKPKTDQTDDMTITIWRSVRHDRPLAGVE